MSTKKKQSAGNPAKKKQPTVPVFDVAPEVMPKHCIVGDEYVVQTEVGEMRVPLRVKQRTVKLMEDLDTREQFDILLAETAPEWVEKLDELDTTDVTILQTLFFVAFTQFQAVRLGEALGSST